MNSQELAHRFFYNPEARGNYANCNAHFSDSYWDKDTIHNYYSYSTRIAAIAKNKHGENVLLISDYKYSRTTAKHLNELRHACPYEQDRIIDVPHCERSGIGGKFGFVTEMERVERMDKDMLNQKYNRETFTKIIRMIDKYVKHFGWKSLPHKCELIRKRKSTADKLAYIEQKELAIANRIVHGEEERAKNREKRAAALQRKIERIKQSGLEQLKLAFAYNVPKGIRDALKSFKNDLQTARDEQGRRYSYVWVDDEMYCKTSQGIRMTIGTVKRLLKLWGEKRSLLGMQADCYTIVENTDDHIKIGCHIIPMWNVQALYNELMK
jgi:hypothetical protein